MAEEPQIPRGFEKGMDTLGYQRPSTTLYHYTSAAGLLGIVESRSLWASGIHYLNDTSEYTHASSVVRDYVTKSLLAEPDHQWRDYYHEILNSRSMFTDAMVFVASLSEAGDKLSQWRAYCPSGAGFSVGFDPDLIHQLAWKQDYQLFKCEYDLTEQSAICEHFISAGCNKAREHEGKEKLSGRMSGGIWQEFLKPLMSIAPALKNPSFVEEQEWRLVRGPFDAPDRGVRFRPGKYAVIPYREFALVNSESSPLSIEELIIGPNPDPEQAENAVRYLFTARGVECKKISRYSGTLRNW